MAAAPRDRRAGRKGRRGRRRRRVPTACRRRGAPRAHPTCERAGGARRRPRPRRGCPAWRATAAAARDPATPTHPSGPKADASSSTRSLSATAAPRPAIGTSIASTSARCNRRTKPLPSPSASTTRTSRSPRRGSASPICSGQPSTQTVASSGIACASSSAVGSAAISSAARHASLIGSFEVSTRADSHHSGPDAGWRSMIRRQAVTRPGGSNPRTRARPPSLARAARVGARSAGHVAEPLDWVHRRHVTPRCRRYLLPPWRTTPPPTSCSRRSTARRGRSASGSRLPPAARLPRPVHERERVGARRGDRILTVFTAADCASHGSSPRRRGRAHVPRAVGAAVPHVRRSRPQRGARDGARSAARIRVVEDRSHDRRRRRGLGPGRSGSRSPPTSPRS